MKKNIVHTKKMNLSVLCPRTGRATSSRRKTHKLSTKFCHPRGVKLFLLIPRGIIISKTTAATVTISMWLLNTISYPSIEKRNNGAAITGFNGFSSAKTTLCNIWHPNVAVLPYRSFILNVRQNQRKCASQSRLRHWVVDHLGAGW